MTTFKFIPNHKLLIIYLEYIDKNRSKKGDPGKCQIPGVSINNISKYNVSNY
jgi:hypothetical protein